MEESKYFIQGSSGINIHLTGGIILKASEPPLKEILLLIKAPLFSKI